MVCRFPVVYTLLHNPSHTDSAWRGDLDSPSDGLIRWLDGWSVSKIVEGNIVTISDKLHWNFVKSVCVASTYCIFHPAGFTTLKPGRHNQHYKLLVFQHTFKVAALTAFSLKLYLCPRTSIYILLGILSF